MFSVLLPLEARTSPFALGHLGTVSASEPHCCHEYRYVLPPAANCAFPASSLPPNCTPWKLPDMASGPDWQGAVPAFRPATDRSGPFLVCRAVNASRCGSAAAMRVCACLPAEPKRVNGELRRVSRSAESVGSAA